LNKYLEEFEVIEAMFKVEFIQTSREIKNEKRKQNMEDHFKLENERVR
jgi:hypothetical protein